jgi:pyridinium-3,5-biscarboxylic acid mononucleotide sulfurtransferase
MRRMVVARDEAEVREAYARILDAMRSRRRVLVAFSGGVDSGLVARLARDALDGDALAVIADAESFARWELEEARAEAAEIGIPLRVVGLSELSNPVYAANPSNRCFFCREGLAEALLTIAKDGRYDTIADGIHVSDLGDDRPGIRAMDAAGFWHPLAEFGLTKPDVRALARSLGLSFADKPSNACLSSRIPHGTPITVDILRRIESAEGYLRDLGFRQVRVRHHGTTAWIEVFPEDIPRLRGLEPVVATALRQRGYEKVVVDPRGYRSLA